MCEQIIIPNCSEMQHFLKNSNMQVGDVAFFNDDQYGCF